MRKEIYGYLIIRLHERDESLNVFLICHQLLSPTIIFRAKFPSHNKIQLNTSSPPQFQTHSKTRSTYRLQNNTRFLTKHDKHDPLKEISTPIRGINSRGAALIKPPSKSLFHRSTPPPFPPSPPPRSFKHRLHPSKWNSCFAGEGCEGTGLDEYEAIDFIRSLPSICTSPLPSKRTWSDVSPRPGTGDINPLTSINRRRWGVSRLQKERARIAASISNAEYHVVLLLLLRRGGGRGGGGGGKTRADEKQSRARDRERRVRHVKQRRVEENASRLRNRCGNAWPWLGRRTSRATVPCPEGSVHHSIFPFRLLVETRGFRSKRRPSQELLNYYGSGKRERCVVFTVWIFWFDLAS